MSETKNLYNYVCLDKDTKKVCFASVSGYWKLEEIANMNSVVFDYYVLVGAWY